MLGTKYGQPGFSGAGSSGPGMVDQPWATRSIFTSTLSNWGRFWCSCQGCAFTGLPASCQLSPCQEHFLMWSPFLAKTDLGLSFPSQHLLDIFIGWDKVWSAQPWVRGHYALRPWCGQGLSVVVQWSNLGGSDKAGNQAETGPLSWYSIWGKRSSSGTAHPWTIFVCFTWEEGANTHLIDACSLSGANEKCFIYGILFNPPYSPLRLVLALVYHPHFTDEKAEVQCVCVAHLGGHS